MIVSKEDIINICSENVKKFKDLVKDIKYEKGGIFNSEMLLITSLIKDFDINLIIESGRANGQSTKIFSEVLRDPKYKIISIEYDKYDPEVKHSYKRLKYYKKLLLLFGDSNKIIHNYITEDCFLLIDGPKRLGAIKLSIECLKNPLVKAVFIHDLHKDSPFRKYAEKLFKNYFFTDDLDYVKRFKSIDKKNWMDQRKYRKTRSWGPYRRGTKRMKSYSSTLLVVFNSKDSLNLSYLENRSKTQEYLKKKWKIKYFFDGIPRGIKKIINYIPSYIFYEKTFDNRRNIDFIDLIKKWVNISYNIIKKLFRKRPAFYKEADEDL